MTPKALSDEQLDALFDATSDRPMLDGDEVDGARGAVGRALLAEIAAAAAPVSPRAERRPGAPAGRRLRPLRARLMTLGAVACVLAVVGLVVAALLPGQTLRSVRVAPVVPAPASAATVLEGLARTAYREPAATIGKGQLEYVKTIQGITSGGFAADAQGKLVGIRFVQTFTEQTWGNVKGIRRDRDSDIREHFFSAADRAAASSHGMTLAELDHTDATPSQVDDLIYPARDPRGPSGPRVDPAYTWPTLPTQPGALLKALRAAIKKEGGQPTAFYVFNLISDGLLFNATSPTLRSALYKVLAHLAGVELLGTRRDALGRRGVAIAIHGHRTPGFVTLFDPSTAEELETEMVNRSPSRNPHIPTIPRGTAQTYTVFIRRGIVNSISDVPGGGHISTRGVPTVRYANAKHGS